MLSPCVQGSTRKLPYLDYLPVPATLKYCAVTGFEIPSLPVLAQEYSDARGTLARQTLDRFQQYLLELHSDAPAQRAIALQLMALPEGVSVAARVRINVLCRSAHDAADKAALDADDFVRHAAASFPRSGMFGYGQPKWLEASELEHACFRQGGTQDSDIDLVELRKFEDRWPWSQQLSVQYVPHRFWANRGLDAWLVLIENLAAVTRPAAVRIELTPTRLERSSGLDSMSVAARWFTLYGQDLERIAKQGEQVRTDGVVTSEMYRAGDVGNFSMTAQGTSYVQRGRHVYEQLMAHADRLFGMRVTIASHGRVPESLIGSVRAALSSPPSDDEIGSLGWVRPDVVRPETEKSAALENLRYLAQTRWGRTDPVRPPGPQMTGAAALGPQVNLRPFATPEEATSLFHLPIFDRSSETSALSTAETPFVIPPESLNSGRIRKEDKAIQIGHLYQRDKLLDGRQGSEVHPFCVTTSDLMKPSLLVGAPGSGKSNLAVVVLAQLWEAKVPFLVLDPSTGEEYRLLLGHESLKDDLIVYTVGDVRGLPLQFNPFAVPPGVTIRNHATRILAAFRAAFSMFDPVPAIYEGALERLYTDERYCGRGRARRMQYIAEPSDSWPILSDFAKAIQDELSEKALTLYEGSAESIGVIRGACTIRVNAIGRKLGYILNVREADGEFFQRLLKRPVVIELGALGDTTNIALLMAFLISQLAGHVEYAARQMPADARREHLILIEEAHRLLGASDGEGAVGKSAEDLNMMLAEVRKFGQGIMTLDQRPSSLVGGVLDNAFVKILTRLSDREGFDRLSDELNMNEAQQRFALTRLKAGQTILLDRDAGQPVLVRPPNIKDDLEKAQKKVPRKEKVERILANARREHLIPPDAVDYVELLPDAKGAAAAPKTPQEWLVAQTGVALKAMLERERRNERVYWGGMEFLQRDEPDIAGAKAAMDAAMEPGRAAFDRLANEVWEKAKWTLLEIVAGEQKCTLARERIRQLKTAPPGVTVTRVEERRTTKDSARSKAGKLYWAIRLSDGRELFTFQAELGPKLAAWRRDGTALTDLKISPPGSKILLDAQALDPSGSAV